MVLSKWLTEPELVSSHIVSSQEIDSFNNDGTKMYSLFSDDVNDKMELFKIIRQESELGTLMYVW